jgi:molybdopterin converting factor subunit 1
MQIRALFFASYRELLGTGQMTLELAEAATVSDLLHEIRGRGAETAQLPEAPVVAVNREFVSIETVLRDGDEVAFVPPVAGG